MVELGSYCWSIAVDNGNGTWTFTFDPAPTADMEYLLVVDVLVPQTQHLETGHVHQLLITGHMQIDCGQ